ncbi:MAG: response regulator [Beijerinckiaceae bacterium]|nr:response regulator [Beijerinckiaceae bacterium]
MLSALSDWLFKSSDLTPHGFCLSWDPALIWTYAVSDAVIALAYFSIPIALAVLAEKRADLVFRPVLWLFAAFILLCGTTHWLDLFTLWVPLYELQAVIKGLTALVSIGTAIALWFYLPNVLLMPSAVQMREANAELLSSRAQLAQAQKMEAVGQLTGGIAHDFNNLLQVITGSLTMMERRITDGRFTETPRYVKAIRQASDTAARLTNRLLAFSRRQALQAQSIEIDRLIEDMADLLRRSLGPSIALDIKPRDGRWNILCDPAQLESVILNLCINARDAMPEGGNLTIATADRQLATEDVADEEVPAGKYVEIHIRDEGLGMSEEVLARVFEPFFTTKPIGEGTGLGLSQVYGFVKQSGGIIKIESAVGAGTSVRLFLPAHEKMASAPTDAGSKQPAKGDDELTGRRVLLVEDRDDVRTQIVDALTDLGCSVTASADAAEALSTLSNAPVDLLITDIGLPGVNGRELARRARERWPGLPVLLITGYAGKPTDHSMLEAGMEILRKPFALDDFVARVRSLVSRQRSTA